MAAFPGDVGTAPGTRHCSALPSGSGKTSRPPAVPRGVYLGPPAVQSGDLLVRAHERDLNRFIASLTASPIQPHGRAPQGRGLLRATLGRPPVGCPLGRRHREFAHRRRPVMCDLPLKLAILALAASTVTLSPMARVIVMISSIWSNRRNAIAMQ